MKEKTDKKKHRKIFTLGAGFSLRAARSPILPIMKTCSPGGKRPTHAIHGPRPLKVDLHLHTADDPLDRVGHTARELILKAADERFDVISITNHDRLTFSPDLSEFARERGLLLIPGIEMTIEGRHVLVLNPAPKGVVSDLSSLSGIRRPETLIVAPHPYFPGQFSLNGHLTENIALFDAIEYCHFYTIRINFNQKALEFSRLNGYPLIGNSDAHFLGQIGTTYSMVYAEKNIESIFAAIRGNRMEVITRPLSPREMGSIAGRYLKMKLQGKPMKSWRHNHSGPDWEDSISAVRKPRKEAA